MTTLQELQHKQSKATVWVTQRRSGARYAQGCLLVALDGIRGMNPDVIVEFPDGVEHFLPDDILLTLPEMTQLTLL